MQNPGLRKLQKIFRLFQYLDSFRLGRNMSAVIVYCVTLAPAGVEIDCKSRRTRSQRKLGGLKRRLMVSHS